MDSPKKNNQKLISIPPELVKVAKDKTKKMGINFSEYVRMLIVRDNLDKFEDVEFLDEEASRDLQQGLEDLKEGRYVSLKSQKDIDEYFKKM